MAAFTMCLCFSNVQRQLLGNILQQCYSGKAFKIQTKTHLCQNLFFDRDQKRM